MTSREGPFTTPVWEDKYGLRIRRTTSPEYYFLDGPLNLVSAMEPFMELPETKAIWHSEARGWLIPVAMFPKLRPFLESFHDVLPTEIPRNLTAAGLEYTPMVVQHECFGLKGQTLQTHATVFKITFQEVRLLALLLLGIENLPREVPSEIDDADLRSITDVQNLRDFGFLQEGGIVLDELFLESTNFGRMYVRYAISRYSEGITPQLGDLLQPAFTDLTSYILIYDVDESDYPEGWFIDLEYFDEVDRRIVPQRFKVPTPFPIMWWSGLFGGGEYVHPNFDELGGSMEYISEPKLPDKLAVWIGNILSAEPNSSAALRFQWPETSSDTSGRTAAKTYYIYFVNLGGTEVTYELILADINNPHSTFQAIDNTIMLRVWSM